MIKLKFIFIFLAFLPSGILAQYTFEKYLSSNHHENSTSVVECITNGFMVSTTMDDCGPCNAYQGLIRLNDFGDTIWKRYYSHGTNDESTGPLINYNNGYILTDNFTSFNSIGTNLAMSIHRIDSSGNPIWGIVIEDTIRDLVCTNVFVEPNGNIFAGYYDSRNGSIFAAKIDSSGNIIWDKKIGIYPPYFSFYDAIADSNNNYFFMGDATWNNLPSTFLLKVDSAGDTLQSTFYPNDTISGRTLVLSDNRSIIIAGLRLDSIGQNQFGLIKLDSNGTYIWGSTLNSINENFPKSMTKTFDNGFAITGIRNDGTPNGKLILMKADQSGNKIWGKTFCLNSCFLSSGNSILETKDSMFLIAGQLQHVQTIPNVYVIKTDSIGDVINEIGIINDDEFQLQILPNPGNGIFKIVDSELAFSGFIYNSLGQVIEEISNSNEINLLNFQAGLYFYQLTDAQNRMFRGKIILI